MQGARGSVYTVIEDLSFLFLRRDRLLVRSLVLFGIRDFAVLVAMWQFFEGM